MLRLLEQLRTKYVIGFVGGSDLSKQQEQLLGKGIHNRLVAVPFVMPFVWLKRPR